MSEINFVLHKDKNFSLIVPSLSEKFNYYYKPTHQLHKFDEVSIVFSDQNIDLELKKDMIDEILNRFQGSLKKAINNELLLPKNIKAGSLGYFLNQWLNNLQETDMMPFWMWSSSKPIATLLYNRKDEIYLEIVPIYPWLFEDPKKEDSYISFDDFLENYKPYAIEVIPRDIALKWQQTCEDILKKID